MKFGIQCEILQDAPTLVEFAVEAERAGWDGFFVWDSVVFSTDEIFDIADPWVTLGAIAARTSRIRLGPMVACLPRRRPWVVARQAASLDRLSNGRLIMGVGLGEGPDIENFGESTDLKVRARQLDEGLDLVTKLWTGKRVDHRGEFYKADGVTFQPTPVQTPRIPIWCGGYWPARAPFRRAARWDGVFPIKVENGEFIMRPDILHEILEVVREHRTSHAPYDIVGSGVTDPSKSKENQELIRAYADVGATWYLESVDHFSYSLPQMHERIRSGPPRS